MAKTYWFDSGTDAAYTYKRSLQLATNSLNDQRKKKSIHSMNVVVGISFKNAYYLNNIIKKLPCR